MRDITFGQYYPTGSIIHKMDPRIKIIAALIYMATIFFAKSVMSYAFMVAVAVMLTVSAKIPLRLMLKGIKPLIFIIIFTSVFNVFIHSGAHPILQWRFINIYGEGVVFAAKMVVRLICLVTGTTILLSYTTTPLELTSGIETLLKPLAKIKVPSHEFAMMISIALRFIPDLIVETDRIISAQKARGADFESGGLIKRAKAFLPVLIPLFVSAFRRADELAAAMECRCYNGAKGRTKMKILRFAAADYVFIAAVCAAMAAMVCLNLAELNLFGFIR